MSDCNTQKIFRVGLIGCGTIAPMHANALTENPNTDFVACCDTDSARADSFATRYRCLSYTDVDTMLAECNLDAVHICTPHAAHFPLIAHCAKKGLAIFTEKPPTTSMEDFETLCALADTTPIGVCFQNRYNDAVVTAKARLEAGAFGAVQGARGFVTWHRDAQYYKNAPWRGHVAEAKGGCLINQSIHTLDLMIYLMGAPERVLSKLSQLFIGEENHDVEVEDTLHALLQYPDGKRGVFFATNGYYHDEKVMAELSCDKATVRMEEDTLTVIWKDGRPRECETFAVTKSGEKAYWGDSHSRCIADFYRSLTEGSAFQNAPCNVKSTMQAVFNIYDNG